MLHILGRDRPPIGYARVNSTKAMRHTWKFIPSLEGLEIRALLAPTIQQSYVSGNVQITVNSQAISYVNSINQGVGSSNAIAPITDSSSNSQTDPTTGDAGSYAISLNSTVSTSGTNSDSGSVAINASFTVTPTSVAQASLQSPFAGASYYLVGTADTSGTLAYTYTSTYPTTQNYALNDQAPNDSIVTNPANGGRTITGSYNLNKGDQYSFNIALSVGSLYTNLGLIAVSATASNSLSWHIISAQTPSVAMTSVPNPSVYGQAVTFTATVSPATSGLPPPTGAVTFMDGSTSLGSGSLNASGIATFTTSTLAVGTHPITADYSGDSNFSGNTSSPITQTVTAPAPTGSVEIDINATPDKADNITLFNPQSTGEPSTPTQTIPAKITNMGTAAGTFQLSVSPAADASLSQTSVTLAAGACTEITITPKADSSAPNDVHIIATQDGTQVGEDSMTIVGFTFGTTEGTNSLDIKNQDTPNGMPDRIPPFGPAPTSITPLYVTMTPDLAGSGQSISLTFLNQDDNNGFAAFENGANAAVVTSSGVVNFTGLQQTAPANANDPSNLSAPNASHIQLAVQVRGQNAFESKGFSVAAIPVNFQSSSPAPYETKARIGMRVDWNLQSDSGNVSDLDAVEESEVIIVGDSSGPFRIISGSITSGYLKTSSVIHNFDRHVIPALLLDLRYPFTGEGGIEFDQAFEFRDARTGASDVEMPNSGFIIRQDYYRSGRTHKWFLTTTKAGSPVTIGKVNTGAGVIVPPPFLTVTQKIMNKFIKHLYIQLNIFAQ